MATSFTAQINDWVQRTEARQEAVFKESTQRVFEEVLRPRSQGGNLRVDTGFLRASFRTSLNTADFTTTPRPADIGSFTYQPQQITATIAAASLDDVIYGVFGANYAIYREFGTFGRPGDAMVRLAVQKWQTIVTEVTTELQAQVSGASL